MTEQQGYQSWQEACQAFDRINGEMYRDRFEQGAAKVEKQLADWRSRAEAAEPHHDLPEMRFLHDALPEVRRLVFDSDLAARYLSNTELGLSWIYFDYLRLACHFVEYLDRAYQALLENDGFACGAFAFAAGETWGLMDEDRLERTTQVERLAARNNRREVGELERASVENMNKSLQERFPKPTPRYRIIADSLEIPVGRVRYIIEGPRR